MAIERTEEVIAKALEQADKAAQVARLQPERSKAHSDVAEAYARIAAVMGDTGLNVIGR
jgi:hypothetical protein